jgi:hypothetical protein
VVLGEAPRDRRLARAGSADDRDLRRHATA